MTLVLLATVEGCFHLFSSPFFVVQTGMYCTGTTPSTIWYLWFRQTSNMAACWKFPRQAVGSPPYLGSFRRHPAGFRSVNSIFLGPCCLAASSRMASKRRSLSHPVSGKSVGCLFLCSKEMLVSLLSFKDSPQSILFMDNGSSVVPAVIQPTMSYTSNLTGPPVRVLVADIAT